VTCCFAHFAARSAKSICQPLLQLTQPLGFSMPFVSCCQEDKELLFRSNAVRFTLLPHLSPKTPYFYHHKHRFIHFNVHT
jgi:hypothetical protein